MILNAMSRYEAFVKEIKALEPGEERIIMVENQPVAIRLVEDMDIRRIRERQGPACSE
ncbi:hypothetical protein [Gorillibacterium sp. sgz5001074]|uniref:hypothetical protein n=1 Tax=Gorillibacterium sp. sgz5001074 TaxID=3446695 RepID=UPI003F66DDB1